MLEFVIEEQWYIFLLSAIACYLIGCFNFAVLISRFKKRDIRCAGSGNPGSMNMTRTFGLKIGAINFFCDLIKGCVPTIIGYFVFNGYVFAGTDIPVSDFARYFFGLFVVIGHIFPVTMKFRGGKGIASTLGLFVGALTCEQWWYFPILVVFHFSILLYIAVTEWGSMGSLMGVALLTVWQAVIFIVRYSERLLNGWVISMFSMLLLLNVLTWGAHRKNIARLFAGEEHRTSLIKRKKNY